MMRRLDDAMDKLEDTFSWYRWVLRFNPVKYLGIFMMTAGPLFLIYRFLFQGSTVGEMTIGSIGFLVTGAFVWSFGWDPYG